MSTVAESTGRARSSGAREWNRPRAVAAATVLSLGLLWLNVLLTTRWASVDGSLNGSKRPYVLAGLAIATLSALWSWGVRHRLNHPPMSREAALAVGAAGMLFLGTCFVIWFPIATWTGIPFLDNWPTRYQATRDAIALLDRGTLAGWEWRFLGGYQTSSDVIQGLGLLAFLPMKLLGAAVGFHVTHVVLFAALPLLIWLDLAIVEARDLAVAAVATGLVCVLAAGASDYYIRSGDTNSLAGLVTAFAAIVGAHAARRGRSWGAWLLIVGLALSTYTHPAFFVYAVLYLALDALVARDRASAIRGGLAVACAIVAALPLTFDSWRYPGFFNFNNVLYRAPAHVDWFDLARKIYYNVELLWLPGRWFNDFTGIALVFLPVTVTIAVADRSRVRFHALAALLTLVLMRLNSPQFGYAFARVVQMLVVFSAPVLALVVVRYTNSQVLRWSLLAVIGLYPQVRYLAVPHVASVRSFDSALVDRVAGADGALVLVENNPHRNMNADPHGTTEPSRFGIHFEALLAAETGRRLYAGYWDGWQWNPWRGQVVAGGTFMGRAIASTPHDAFAMELRRWGVVELFVWSRATVRYLEADERFRTIWAGGAWTQFRFGSADPREVAVPTGHGRLENIDPTGADVLLSGSRSGEPVIVRTNFHPAWTAWIGDRPVPLVERDGQVSFDSPCDGDCRVTLRYPKRQGLIVMALAVVLAGAFGARRFVWLR